MGGEPRPVKSSKRGGPHFQKNRPPLQEETANARKPPSGAGTTQTKAPLNTAEALHAAFTARWHAKSNYQANWAEQAAQGPGAIVDDKPEKRIDLRTGALPG